MAFARSSGCAGGCSRTASAADASATRSSRSRAPSRCSCRSRSRRCRSAPSSRSASSGSSAAAPSASGTGSARRSVVLIARRPPRRHDGRHLHPGDGLADARATITRYTRLLLLPIPAASCTWSRSRANLADPWLALVAAGLLAFAVGSGRRRRPGAASAALARRADHAGAARVRSARSLGFLVGWLFRSRRRGELFTLSCRVRVSLRLVPADVLRVDSSRDAAPRGRRSGEPRRTADHLRGVRSRRCRRGPARCRPRSTAGRCSARFVGDAGRRAFGICVLGGQAALLFVASSRVHRRMLESLEGDVAAAADRRAAMATVPGLPLLITGGRPPWRGRRSDGAPHGARPARRAAARTDARRADAGLPPASPARTWATTRRRARATCCSAPGSSSRSTRCRRSA